MELYLLKFSGCLLVFWAVYVLLLEKQKMHNFKRFYLLGAFLVALIIPLITVTYYVEPVIDFGTFDPNTSATPPYFPAEIATITQDTSFNYLPTILWSIYAIGVLIFSIRFISNLVTLYKRISKNETIKQHPFIYVLMQHYHIPHSFFNYIFFSKSKFDIGDIPREVILHEETHAKQLHSLDIVAVELLQIAFWFHPLVYVLKHHIKLNHEFLADQAVLDQGTDTKNYQHILLQFSSSTSNNQLASAINYSSIKKRFTVMKTQTSKTKIWLSTLILLPILAVLFYSFSEREIVEIENNVSNKASFSQIGKTQNKNKNEGTSEALMNEYKAFIKKYKETNIIYGDSYERAKIIYDELMSDAQRASVEKYPKPFVKVPNLSKTIAKAPTKAQFEDFKDAKTYAIWIDNKHVSNSELNNYQASDFVHYSGSKVFKNARSKKFPQPNQYHLYTKSGFKSTYQDSQLKSYKKASEKYSNEIKTYLKGSQTDNSELKILYNKALKIYNTFSSEELKKHSIKQPPPPPAKYSTPRNINQQNPPTKQDIASPKQVADYNNWAKRMSDAIKNSGIGNYKGSEYSFFNEEDYNKYERIFIQIMTPEQRKNVVGFPKIFPPPPPSPSKQNPPTAKEIREYNIWAKKISTEINTAVKNKSNEYPIIKLKDLERYKSILSRMFKKQKENAELFPNIDIIPIPKPRPGYKSKNKGGPNTNIIKTTSAECLEIPKSFITTDGKTLKISCIENYTDNKFKIYNRWGALVYSKENYNNTWDGTIEESFAVEDSDKPKSGTYYYVFSSPNLEEPKAGPININESNFETLELKKVKSKGGPNPDNYSTNSYNSDLKNEYLKKYKEYETLRYAKPHFLRKTKADKKRMNDLWMELRQMHIYKLGKTEKKELNLPITPIAPYVKINLDGKSYYKVRSKLTEKELKSTISLPVSPTISESETLLDNNDPIIIPIENYTLKEKTVATSNSSKREVFITISEDGTYAINKDNALKEFEILSLKTLENLMSKLSKEEIENTFIFSSTKDYKKFRSKPSASPEYQDDILVKIIKNDIRFPVSKSGGKYVERISYQSVLDNKPSEALKTHTQKLSNVFKKYGIKNITF